MIAPVSVVVPVYNGEAYLAETLDCLLDQTRPPAEIIVADDGSTDRSGAIADARGEPVRRLALPHRGVSAALNAGVAAARSEWLCFLDADDLWPVEKLERQLAVVGEPAAPDMLFGHARNFRAEGPSLLPIPGPSKGTLMIRRERFLSVGEYDESLSMGEFIDWYARAREAGLSERMMDDVLLLRRVHDSNTGRDLSLRRQFALVAKRALDRRRQGSGNPDGRDRS